MEGCAFGCLDLMINFLGPGDNGSVKENEISVKKMQWSLIYTALHKEKRQVVGRRNAIIHIRVLV